VAHAIRFLSNINHTGDSFLQNINHRGDSEATRRISVLKPCFFREGLVWIDSLDPRVSYVAANFYINSFPTDLKPDSELGMIIAACKPRAKQSMERLLSWKLDKEQMALPSAWLFGDEGKRLRIDFIQHFHKRLGFMNTRVTFMPSMISGCSATTMCCLHSPFPSAAPYEVDPDSGKIFDDRSSLNKCDIIVAELQEAEALLARAIKADTPTERIKLAHASIKVRKLSSCFNAHYNVLTL
jgi:hypothetical protein